MEFTGERFVPALKGQIYYEHLHRYAIAARFCAGKRVLDIASGEGYGAALLARSAAEVIGVDIDETSVEHARRTYYATNLRFLRGSVTEIPLADASVDVVASFETIEHVGEHERMLDELRRVLAPGGIIVLSSPNKLVYSDVPGFDNPFHVKELYFSELRDLLTRRFRHVALYGQRVSASSVVHPLAGSVSELASWFNGSIDRIGTGLPTLANPVYFVAVCSDEPVSVDVSSAYLDATDDLLEDIWIELNTLRRDAAAALKNGTPQAALTDGSPGVWLQEGDETGSVEPSPARDDLERDREESSVRIATLEVELADVRERCAIEAADLKLRHEDDLAGIRAHLEAELAKADFERRLEVDRIQNESEAQLAALRRRFEEDAAQLVLVHESREAILREEVAMQLDCAHSLERQLEDARLEIKRGRDAALSISAELQDERSRSKRLIEEFAEDRAELLNEHHEALLSEQHARAEAEDAVGLLHEEVDKLSDALRRAEADSYALRDVLSSHSWKLTQPLRRAVALIRR